MAGRTEKEKMLAGELYWGMDPSLVGERTKCRQLLRQYNTSSGESQEERTQLLKQLLGAMDEANPPFIEPPFNCDYGSNIRMGSNVYMNFNCCVLDCMPVTIGSRVLFGPNVQLYTPEHPLDPSVRMGTAGPEFARSIVIGDDCWICGGAIIKGGVTIGAGSTVGAGAVVTKDVPPLTVVAGNPARVVKAVDGSLPKA